MKAQDLKKSILQYAVQGKLVEQNPQDEPASELLKRIKTEKEQLIKEGKIKKEKPLPPITQDEIPYDLPQGWQWIRLGELGITTTGTTPSTNKPEFFGGKYSFVKPADITNSGEIIYNKQTLSDLGIKNGRFIPKNSILMVCIGGSIGKVGFTKKDCSCNQQINAITPFIEELADYIFIALISPFFYNKVLSVAPQTTLPIISKGKWESLILPLPPLAEQKRIVERLEEILPLVDEYGKNEEILSEMNQKLPKQIRQSILQYAVQGKLVPQNPNDEPASELLKRIKAQKEQLIKDGKIKKEKPLLPITQDEIPYELPRGWEWVRLGGICKLEQGAKVNNVRLPLLNARYLRYRTDKQILSDGQLVQKDSYIILVDGENSGEVFKVFEDGIMGSTFKLLSINSNTNIDFILYILKYYQDVFRYSKKGAAIPHLDKELFKNIVIGLPPLAEQKRIVAKVEELMKLVDMLS